MSVNKVILIGNVGKDPEIKYFDNDRGVANFSLATTERGFTAANGTTVPDRTEWHNISCWGGLAKIAEQYVKKGDPLYIEGKIRTRSYDDKNGIKRYVTEIHVDSLEMLGRKQGSSSTTTIPESKSTSTESQPTSNDIGDDLPF